MTGTSESGKGGEVVNFPRDPARDGHESPPGGFWTSRAFVVFAAFAAIAMTLLWTEHRAHVLGILPFLFILACPLLHTFMHGRHGRHGKAPKSDSGAVQ